MKTYPVKWLSSEMQGAPQHIKNTEGLLIQHLKALLVTGFGALTPTSIVWDATLLKAKATFGSGHKYLKDSVIAVSGSTLADYNGEHLVTLVDTNNVWFELDTVPAGAASGTLEMKYPPLGWSISHESGDGKVAIFVAAGDLGEVSLRVDNSPYTGYKKSYYWTAKVQMVTNVVDINTYELCENDDYHHWNSCSVGYEHASNWKIVGDDRFFTWFTKAGSSDRHNSYMAGYIDSRKAGDRYHFIVDGGNLNAVNNYSHESLDIDVNCVANLRRRIARKYHQLEGATNITYKLLFDMAGNSDSNGVSSPNPVDNAFLIVESAPMVVENTITSIAKFDLAKVDVRGTLPHFREVITKLFAYKGKVINKSGRRYLLQAGSIAITNSPAEPNDTLVAFDITPVEV